MTLYIFNPEHDYALANNNPHFMAPASSVRFADECALFLRYLLPEDGVIYLPYHQKTNFYHTQSQQFTNEPGNIDQIKPWGWDALMGYQLQKLTFNNLIDHQQIDNIRKLAHRQQTISAMEYLRTNLAHLSIPNSPILLQTDQEVANFVHQQREVILKSPYSGNGRGNLFAHNGQYTPTLQRQTNGVLRKQGSLLGEPLYSVIQDFAMEFQCVDGKVDFVGYSLFNTKHYGYAGNLLICDQAIEKALSKWINTETLLQVKDVLIQYLQSHFAPIYNGYIGVDMFVYEQDNTYFINPMVEINVRMTMGIAAHILYEKYVHPSAIGTMHLLFNPQIGGLKQWLESQPSMQITDKKWYSGTLALTPVHAQTQYAIVVSVNVP